MITTSRSTDGRHRSSKERHGKRSSNSSLALHTGIRRSVRNMLIQILSNPFLRHRLLSRIQHFRAHQLSHLLGMEPELATGMVLELALAKGQEQAQLSSVQWSWREQTRLSAGDTKTFSHITLEISPTSTHNFEHFVFRIFFCYLSRLRFGVKLIDKASCRLFIFTPPKQYGRLFAN